MQDGMRAGRNRPPHSPFPCVADESCLGTAVQEVRNVARGVQVLVGLGYSAQEAVAVLALRVQRR